MHHSQNLSPDDKYYEELYSRTTFGDSTGRYYVHLPLRENHSYLGESYHSALRRSLLLEKRLNANQELKEQYDQFIHEYLRLGHMSPGTRYNSSENYSPYW